MRRKDVAVFAECRRVPRRRTSQQRGTRCWLVQVMAGGALLVNGTPVTLAQWKQQLTSARARGPKQRLMLPAAPRSSGRGRAVRAGPGRAQPGAAGTAAAVSAATAATAAGGTPHNRRMVKLSSPPNYGSDRNGLVCGFLFSANGPSRSISLDEAKVWLAEPPPVSSGGFLWLHFNLADASAEAWMRANLSLVPEYFEALHEGSRSTRIEDASDHLVAVINDVAYEFSFDPSEIASLWMTVNSGLAVTARTHPLRSIDRLRQAVREGGRFDSSVALLNHLLRDQGDVLVRIVREATLQVDSVEDNLAAGQPQRKRAALGKLRRLLVRLQRLLAPEPGALFRLLRQPPPWIAPHDLDELRQSTEEFSLVLRDLAALQERIKLLQEEVTAQVVEQTSRSVFTLTVVTVLALPINIIAGLLGMNVGGIPLADSPHGFLIIALIVLSFTVVAGWLAFRRRD